MSEASFDGAKVLITGASGFLGSHLCQRLLDAGAEVHATSRSARTSRHPRLHWRRTELGDERTVQALLREIGPGLVFHLAGQVSAAPHLELNLPAFHSLLTSTVNLLTAVTEVGGARLVVTGSLTEPDGAESAPSSPYAAAKWASSAYSRMFHALYDTPVVIVRPFMTYGPGQGPQKLVPHVIRCLLTRAPLELSSGSWQADWVFVDDVIDGFLRAASRPGVEGGSFDLGSGALTSIRQIVEGLVGRIDPAAEPRFGAVPDRPDEVVRRADVATARRALGWQAKVSLEDGLARTIDWFRERIARPGTDAGSPDGG